MKDRQYNDKNIKDKIPIIMYKTLHIKLLIEQHETHKTPGVNSCATER